MYANTLEFKDTVEMAEANRGVIEGGTWEHRKRAKEMLATADAALNLTVSLNTFSILHFMYIFLIYSTCLLKYLNEFRTFYFRFNFSFQTPILATISFLVS